MIKKTTSKKAVKKTTTTKKPAKKATTPRSTTKKTTASRSTTKQTNIIANIDIGFGNTLYIRGEGGGLSWDKGLLLENISSSEWALKIEKATGTITFKFLINDKIWSEGENLSIQAGRRSVHSPVFIW